MINFIKSILGDRKKLSIAGVVVISAAIVLTVFVAQKQQEIRQRAAGEQVAFFFSTGNGCANPVTATTFGISTTAGLSLCLNSNNTGVSIVNGFDVTIAKGTGVTFTGITDGVDGARLTTTAFNTVNSDGTIRYSKIDVNNTISGTALYLGRINLTTASTGTGNISITRAQVISPASTTELSAAKPVLPYTISATNTPTPTTTAGCPNGNVASDGPATTRFQNDAGIHTLSFNHTVGTGTNRLLLVGVNLRTSSGGVISRVESNGTRLTQIGTETFFPSPNNNMNNSIWYMLNPPSGASNIVVTADRSLTISAGASSWSNVNQNTPFGSYIVRSGTSGTPTLTGDGASCGVVSDNLTTSVGDCPQTPLPHSSQTQLWSLNVPGDNLSDHGGKAQSAGSWKTASSQVTMSWNDSPYVCSSSDWILKAIPIIGVGTDPMPPKQCDSGPVLGPCVSNTPNTCNGSGTQTRTLTTRTDGQQCTQVVQSNISCNTAPDNCTPPNVCNSNRQCVAPTVTSAPTPTRTQTPTPIRGSTPTPTSTPTPIPDCNGGGTCTACVSNQSNTCDGSGTQTCTYTLYNGNSVCNTVTANVTCNTAPPNCSSGYTCNAGRVCVPNPTTTPVPPTPTRGGGPTPTPTPITGTTQIALDIGIDGIGSVGDHTNPDPSASTKNPQHPTRNITVELYNGSETLVSTFNGTIQYNSGTGRFAGTVGLAQTASGNYIVKVKSLGTLKKRIPGITALIAGQTYNASAVNLTVGDINGDNQLNIADYNILNDCIFTPASTHGTVCSQNPDYAVISDLNDNGVKNILDYSLFVRELIVQTGD